MSSTGIVSAICRVQERAVEVSDIGRIDGISAGFFIFSAVVAAGMFLVRRAKNLKNRPGQWLSDALNINTLLVMGLLTLSSLPTPVSDIAARIASGNGVLTTISCVYVVIIVANHVVRESGIFIGGKLESAPE